MENKFITIGLGTGRCGSHTLDYLLNSQKNAMVAHEMNSDQISWDNSQDVILSNLNEFEKTLSTGHPHLTITHSLSNEELLKNYDNYGNIKLVGDVGFYYLPYIDIILKKNQDVRFVCLRRDEHETVRSYLRKTLTYRDTSLFGVFKFNRVINRNHWIKHNGLKWNKDALWDKCYPKYAAKTKEEALHYYWQDYYNTIGGLESKYPDNLKIFDIEDLNSQKGQEQILSFIGIPIVDMIFKVGTRKNVSKMVKPN